MPSPATQLQQIREFPELLRYLEDELEWPLEEYGFDDLTFAYEPAELGLKDDDAAKVKSIHQLRPLRHEQPWGVFFVEFEQKKLPVVVLRRILSYLVVKKRAAANAADARRWESRDLLFVSAFGDPATADREIAFAHFHESPGDLPTLRVLGWDGGNTALTLASVAQNLRERLRWPGADESPEQWRERWGSAFRHRIGHRIRTADSLAETLAALARGIRDKARTMLAAESERGALTKLFRAFQTALIHDLTPDTFADTYAQTITYGLLTAAISRTDMTGGAGGTVVLAEDMASIVPVTNPFLKEMLQTFLKVGGRRGGIDFDELGIQDVVELLRGDETDLPAVIRDFGHKNPEKDPVIHFYEHFLSAYDHAQKVKRGVFYTPPAVVSYIVRSVHELLITEFGLADGLADTATWGEMQARIPGLRLPDLSDDPARPQPLAANEPFVQVLDPATGTATFLVEVIDVIHRTLAAKWRGQNLTDAQREAAWNDYVPKHLLPRLHGYELMMAPYAVAHMKIGLKLAETGYRFGTEERARVYLTNALEPKVTQLPQIGFDALAHEAAAVNEVKWKKRFTVVIGNPPYATHSANKGEWIEAPIREAFYPDDHIKESNPKLLLDDYVKFIHLAKCKLNESAQGIFGFITNHSFVENPSFRRLRSNVCESFDQLYILDLHGNKKKREVCPDGSLDDNVFEIQQGVSINCFCLGGCSADAHHISVASLFGLRDSKYRFLASHSVRDTQWQEIQPESPFLLFFPPSENQPKEYSQMMRLQDAMPTNTAGVKSNRDHFLVAFEEGVLTRRITEFADIKLEDDRIREEFALEDGPYWNTHRERQKVRDCNWKINVVNYHYRPLDFRSFLHQRNLIEIGRGGAAIKVMAHLRWCRSNIALAVGRQGQVIGGDSWNLLICTQLVTDTNIFYRGGAQVFPLWLGETQNTNRQNSGVVVT